jgi:HEPN domain
VGFHAQQAAEKALKAVLAASGDDFPWTHDLRHLMDPAPGGGNATTGVVARGPCADPVGCRCASRRSKVACSWIDRHGASVLVNGSVSIVEESDTADAIQRESPTLVYNRGHAVRDMTAAIPSA